MEKNYYKAYHWQLHSPKNESLTVIFALSCLSERCRKEKYQQIYRDFLFWYFPKMLFSLPCYAVF